MHQKTLEQQLKETADLVETAVKDLPNKASKAEVLALIEERTKYDRERIAKSATDVETLNSGPAETKEATAQIQKQLQDQSVRAERVFSRPGARVFRAIFKPT